MCAKGRTAIAGGLVAVMLAMVTAVPNGAQAHSDYANRYRFASRGNRMTISGTSTLHGWSVKSSRVEGEAEFPAPLPPTTPLTRLTWLRSRRENPRISVKIPVYSLKSGDRGLDDDMYAAFQARSNPYIVYRLDEIWGAKAVGRGCIVAQAAGDLTIAGVTRRVRLLVVIARPDASHLTIRGHERIDMTYYGIKPPTAFFGLIRAGRLVRVAFSWSLVREP